MGSDLTVRIQTAQDAVEAARGYAESIAGTAITRDGAGKVPQAELATRVAAAEALLRRAAQVQESVGRVPADFATAAQGSIAVAQAKAFASEVAAEVSSEMFSLAGASAADEKYDLSRHWRNARTHASHDPVSWKYDHVGNYLLNDVLPHNHGQF
jgi:alkylation response protein AidB-like acyl-CoA dehydrogenase